MELQPRTDDGAADAAAHPVRPGRTRPPRQRLATAPREGLLAKLDATRGSALAIVQSPAGFGKTVLLSQWYERLRADPAVTVAWLTLDEADREVTRFVADVGVALAGAGVPIPADCLEQARSSGDVAHRLARICAAIDQRQRPVVLLLDDYHRAAAPEVARFVEGLIRADAGHLQLVLATRDHVDLRIADLEAQGLVQRIGARELILTRADTRLLFGPDWPAEAVDALHDRTEGWAVALQLARLWIEDDPARQAAVAGFTGRTDALARYLVERVLEDVDPDVRAFLTETALLDTFDAATADAVRGTTDAAALLARLRPFDALLVALDPQQRWFRYHQLFAEFLGAELERRTPGRSATLLQAAADYFLAAGNLDRAVSYACRAGDTARAVAAVDHAGGWEIVLQRGIGYARGLIAHFDPVALERQPVLLRIRGYLAMKDGALADARQCIDAAAQADPTPGGHRDTIIVDALLRTYADDFAHDEWAARVVSDLAGLAAHDAIGRGTLHAALAVHALGRGDFAAAERESGTGVAAMVAASSVLGEAYCRFHRARALLLTGRAELAEGELRGVLADVERRHGGDRALTILGRGLLGAVLWTRGTADAEARALLAEAVSEVAEHDSWLDALAATYEAGLRQALQAGTHRDAHALLDRAEAVAAARRWPQLAGLVAAWRIEALVAADRCAEATAAGAALVAGSAGSWRVRHATALAMAQLALRTDRSAEALRSLRAARSQAATQGREPDLLRIELLVAVAYRSRGDRAAMLDAGRAALANPAAAALPGIVQGLALDLAPLLATLGQDEALDASARRAAQRLRALLAPPAAVPPDGFSARELAVLAGLCEGLANKEIGRRLDLSENTVKFHLKNLYAKLGTGSRSGAVHAALGRGLIRA